MRQEAAAAAAEETMLWPTSRWKEKKKKKRELLFRSELGRGRDNQRMKNKLTNGNGSNESFTSSSSNQISDTHNKRMKTRRESCARERAACKWLLLLATTLFSFTLHSSSLTDGAGKAEALRLNSIQVPAAVMNSSSQLMLICDYELQGDQLYSVKWYKNWREFYSFQPVAASEQSADAESESHWKHEFEVEGINLNLAKSNATHVYLRTISLSSEGTYKCEVSADSPSFATVSMERQMKVYVLPKQKLTIIDNNNQPIQLLSDSSSQLVQQQHRPNQALIYNVNEQVNLTCISGPSKPAAKLQWFLNEKPVPSSSKLLSWRPSLNSTNNSRNQEQLSETRLTLAFRLQPSHLMQEQSSAAHRYLHQYQAMRVRCVAKLSVEYSTESNLLVSGGHASNRIKQQQHPTTTSQQLPTPQSSVRFDHWTAAAGGGGGGTELNQASSPFTTNKQPDQLNNQSSLHNYPIYRWPRPSGSKSTTRPMSPARRGSESSDLTTAGSSTTVLDLLGQESEQIQTTPTSRNGRLSGRGGGLVPQAVWTSRQLRAQADHIEMLLRISRPNDLEPPLIEAQNMPSRNLQPYFDSNYPTTLSATENGSAQESESTEQENMGTEQESGMIHTTIESTTGEPFATTGSLLNWDESLTPASPDGAVAAIHITRSSSTNENWQQSNNNKNQQQTHQAQAQKDYELNDIAQFKCTAQMGGPTSGQHQTTTIENPLIESTKRLRLNWFINNREINGALVNAFDGSKFYHAQDSQGHLVGLPPGGALAQSDQRSLQADSSTLQPLVTAPPTTSEDFHSASADLDSQESAELVAAQTTRPTKDSKLVVEFTSSLFQIKELNLRCRSLVEQPLIEFESQLLISIPSSSLGQQFVQAPPSFSGSSDQSKATNPKAMGAIRGYQLRNATRSRNRHSNSVATPSSSSTGSVEHTTSPMTLFIVLLLQFAVASLKMPTMMKR